MKTAKIGIILDRQVMEERWRFGVFEVYIEEILAHAGTTYQAYASVKRQLEWCLETCLPYFPIA